MEKEKESKMTLKEKIMYIQQELNVPKKRWNKFGEFYYRSCEDILEASKELLKKYKVILTLTDHVEEVGGKNYVVAIAEIEDLESDENATVRAYAREAETKKGMDASQLTGTASSYARKYALNGLFCLDDNKDADSDEFQKQEKQEQETPKATEKQLKLIQDMYSQDVESLKEILYNLNKTKVVELNVKEASDIISRKKGM